MPCSGYWYGTPTRPALTREQQGKLDATLKRLARRARKGRRHARSREKAEHESSV
jgi:hypothetical protein